MYGKPEVRNGNSAVAVKLKSRINYNRKERNYRNPV